MSLPAKKDYQTLLEQINLVYQEGRRNAAITVNAHLVKTYWAVGQYIVEFEQKGQVTAEYGKQLLPQLSKDLSISLGKGFSRSNLNRMRQFYLEYPNCAELPHNLSWTHCVELLKVENSLERAFYEKQTLLENCSTTELIRQEKALYKTKK